MKNLLLPLTILLMFSCPLRNAQAQEKKSSTSQNRLQENGNPLKDTFEKSDEKVRIAIDTQAGKVAWSKIAKEVAGQIGVEIPALQRLSLGGELDLKAPSTRWILVGVNLALQPSIRISANRRKEKIVIEIDPTEIENARKKWGARLRSRKTDSEVAKGEKFTIEPYDSTKDLKKSKRIVLIVHGFNSSPSQFKTLAQKIESEESDPKKSFTTASFHYSTRQGVQRAALLLEEELKELVTQNPDCEITLVTHSMGGIVSRWMIESEGFDIKQVKKIIMVAPPNKGSNLALLPVGTEKLETMMVYIDRTKMRKMIRNIVSEVNSAVGDLRPNSDLLKKLASLKRNPNVKYSIIVGNQALLSSAQAEVIRTLAARMYSLDQKHVYRSGAEVSDILGKLANELVSPNGDGVVSTGSGKLKGVDDTVVLKFKHNDISNEDSKAQAAIIKEILKRL